MHSKGFFNRKISMFISRTITRSFQTFVFLHTNMAVLDTRSSLPGYNKTREPEGTTFPEKKFHIDSVDVLSEYWEFFQIVALSSNLGMHSCEWSLYNSLKRSSIVNKIVVNKTRNNHVLLVYKHRAADKHVIELCSYTLVLFIYLLYKGKFSDWIITFFVVFYPIILVNNWVVLKIHWVNTQIILSPVPLDFLVGVL